MPATTSRSDSSQYLASIDEIDVQVQSQQNRGRRLLSAWITMVPSKGITILLQMIAIPIVYHAIGPAQFAAYAAVTSAIMILSFLNLGMGGALVTPLAQASATHDRERESRLFCSALVPIASAAGLALCIALPLLWSLPLKLLFGIAASTVPARELRIAALFACVGTLAVVPFSVIDSARQAYQEMHISNIFGTLSNGALCVGLILVAWFAPTLSAFVAVTALLPLAVRALNLVLLFAGRPHLIRMRRGWVSWALMRSLAGDGLSYMGAAAIANVLLYEWPTYYIARVRPALESSTFAVYLRLVLLVLSFGVSFLQPLWPAIADATAKADADWVLRAVRRARLAALGYGVFGLLTFGFGMNALLKLWLHRPIHVQSAICWLAGGYLLLAMWEYVHWPIALGLGKMRAASHLVFFRAVVFALVLPLAARYSQVAVMALFCASVIFVSAWRYPQLLSKALEKLNPVGVPL